LVEQASRPRCDAFCEGRLARARRAEEADRLRLRHPVPTCQLRLAERENDAPPGDHPAGRACGRTGRDTDASYGLIEVFTHRE
jgi:hypothetical protein